MAYQHPQERFLALVSAETLLVGHALENDLRVLYVLHGRIVDTAIMYPHPKARLFAAVCRLRTPIASDPVQHDHCHS